MKKIIFALLIYITGFSQQKIEVFFDFNKDIPNVNSTDVFNKWMNENKDVEVVKLSGYCDSVDNSLYNKELASRRINTILKNLNLSKISISPNVVLDNNGKDFRQSKNQAENRKVVVYYQKKASQNTLSENVKTAKKGDLIKLKNLYFLNNSDVLVTNSEPVLKELLSVMIENPKLKIEIQGHICCKRPEQPDEVSRARAKAVYDFLVKNKINTNRLTYKGYGVSRPIHPIPEANIHQEDENRRVEIKIIEN